jgi:hypothetical protein
LVGGCETVFVAALLRRWLEGLKALLLVESPLAFRRRQIFVSADALSRPRDREATPLAPP